MKKLILVVSLIVGMIFGVSCKGSTTPDLPPTGPPYPYVTYSVNLALTVTATSGVTYTWDIFVGIGDVPWTTISSSGGFYGVGEAYVTLLASATEWTVPVKWKLVSCSGGSSWAESAVYKFSMLVSLGSGGIAVEPTTWQSVGPFTGWKIGEVKELSFKIKKL